MSDLGAILIEYSGLIATVAVAIVAGVSEYRIKRDKKINALESEKKRLEDEAEKKARQKEKEEIYQAIDDLREECQEELGSIKERIKCTEESQQMILNRMDDIMTGLEKVIKITLEDREIIENFRDRFEIDHRSTKNISDKLDDIQQAFEKQNEDMQRISANLHNSIIYTQSVANVVTTLAEALRDNHMNSNITECVSEFRKKEQEVFTAISEANVLDSVTKKTVNKRARAVK